MAIEALILAVDGSGWRKQGYIIYERNSPFQWGSKEGLPNFIIVTITGDLTVAQARAYREQWQTTFAWDVQSHTSATDSYNVLVHATPINASGEGQLTWAKISNALSTMNIDFVSEDGNGVIVDYTIYEVAISQWFWGNTLVGVSFQEISYDSGTGVHRIEADYSAAGWDAQKVQQRVEANGGSVVSHAASVITFDINRTDVNQKAKEWFDQIVESKVEERRFYVDPTYVDQVVAGTYPGQVGGAGFDTRTKAEFLALILDRIDE